MIQFKNISLSFDNKEVFKDFNLKIDDGEKVLLLAPSGKGKSSLLKMLLGFLEPDKGDIIYKDKILNKHHVKFFRKNIAYLSQDVDLRNILVKDLLKEIHAYKINDMIYDEERILQLFDKYDLDESSLDHYTNELSGGERQRLGFIICILLDRPVWVLDELTSGLDQDLKRLIMKDIMNQEKTVIIISHDEIWHDEDKLRIVRW